MDEYPSFGNYGGNEEQLMRVIVHVFIISLSVAEHRNDIYKEAALQMQRPGDRSIRREHHYYDPRQYPYSL